MDPQTCCSAVKIAPLIGACATTVAVLVALFREPFLAWWRRPQLTLQIRQGSPDRHLTEVDIGGGTRRPAYYFMLWVTNHGRGRADKVQVFAANLTREHPDGNFREESRFIPMNLSWAHGGSVFLDGISQDMGRHCSLGCIAHPSVPWRPNFVPQPKTWLALETEFKPFANSHLLEPGRYRLLVQVAAANAKPIEKTLEIAVSGDWFDNDTEMLSKGISLGVV